MSELNTHSSSQRSRLTQRIKSAALELGFDLVGVSAVTTLDDESSFMKKWLEEGRHGSMTYLERQADRRADPTLIVPGAQSVIVVAKNYYTPFDHDESGHKGKISRYAWGDDYHDVMGRDLDTVVGAIQQLDPDSVSRRYVDTGPVMEKQWAVRAGIGWQGKNSNIIAPRLGSYFFLGVIITTALLSADKAIDDYCGSCTACLEACPTHAIVEPYVVDATKCLSYWTIETKGQHDIPVNIVENMDGWIYGCDVCQEVCPWNRFRKDCGLPSFQPRHDQTSLDLHEVLEMTVEDFRERFASSPVKRPKLDGLKRNARALEEFYQRG